MRQLLHAKTSKVRRLLHAKPSINVLVVAVLSHEGEVNGAAFRAQRWP